MSNQLPNPNYESNSLKWDTQALNSFWRTEAEKQAAIDQNYRMGVRYLLGTIKERKFTQKGDRLAYAVGKLFPLIFWVQMLPKRLTPEGRARWRALREYDGKKRTTQHDEHPS